MPMMQSAITGPEWFFIIGLLAFFLTGDYSMDPIIRSLVGRPTRNRPEQNTDYLELYYRPTCPYCLRVITRMRRLGIHLKLHNIRIDEQARQRLVNQGGKQMVPCLRIEEDTGTRWLYESADIADFLGKHYGPER